MSLWPIQSAALLEIEEMRGALLALGCGAGKTLVSLLAGSALGVERVVLLVPPSLKHQLLAHDIPRLLKHWEFSVPHVVSYSELSGQKTGDALEKLNPELIVADEAHSLKAMSSARTKRFLRYMQGHPGTAFVALSGTMTSKSLRDYAHLAELALGDRSPVPQHWGTLEDWCVALDPSDYSAPPGALMKLCEEKEHGHSNVRELYRCRLTSSFGVVATAESALGTSLTIRLRRPGGDGEVRNCGLRNPHGKNTHVDGDVGEPDDRNQRRGGKQNHRGDRGGVPEAVAEALTRLRETWTRPDGEELEEATRFYQVASQIAQGFYLRWAWPKGQVDEEWLAARSEWHRECRAYLRYHSGAGRDSSGLVAALATREPERFQTWAAWDAVRHRKAPPTEAVWLSDYLVCDAAEWLKDGGITWVSHPALGEAISKKSSSPFFGAGEDEGIGKYSGPSLIASIQAHGTGKNLQRYSRTLFTSVPGNKAFEQAIARCHRPGQEADEVQVEVYTHTAEFRAAWGKALEQATYVQDSTGQRQKLLMAKVIE